LRQATLEEAYEVVHAIETGDALNLKEELGDILLHVVFHSDIARRTGEFTIDDVIASVADKMVRRHPHVFGTVEAATSEAVLRNWEELKRLERAAKGSEDHSSLLEAVHRHTPAVMESQALSEKAAKVGFDWNRPEDVRGKIEEELNEISAVMLEPEEGRQGRLEDEMGDLLFAVINLGRKLGVDAETALRRTNRKFRSRFAFVEEGLRKEGKTPKEATLDEMEALWQSAKIK
ncbi:MAG: nucleoside triphosphate pyrophosphohydrolase, partial [Vicinamibacteria bacterium]|nr:nucleoside triphosphate pyrophosphohydrolase [Vicinamibacteria bacterium]